MQKLYLIVRVDLPMGAQLVQIGHAATGFAVGHPEITATWLADPNIIVALEVADESELDALLQRIYQRPGCAGAAWYVAVEPDLGDQRTALAIQGTPAVVKALASMPRAHRPIRARAVVELPVAGVVDERAG